MRRALPSAPQSMAPWGPIPPAFQPHHAPPYTDSYGHQQQPPSWPQEPAYAEPPQYPHQRNLPSRGSGDTQAQRVKDEQRRKQIEYHQALATQVQERERHKQRERELQRRNDEPTSSNSHEAAPPQRGLFDGLGQNNPSQRGGHFGRGRRDPQPVIPPVPVPAHPHQVDALPPPHPNYPPPHPQGHHWPQPDIHQHPQASDWSGHQVDQFQPPSPTREQPPHPHSSHPPQAVTVGRRRTDLHTGGVGSDAQAMQRQQQQYEMQESLRRQIEEKQRAKLEEKRKRDEEERREIEKFEQERQRQQQEQERLKDERRRKAQAEEEQFRHQQQQLAAATAAAAQEQRQLKDQRHPQRHSPEKMGTQTPVNEPPNGLQRDPFANSRAHLFRDPTPPQRSQPQSVHNPQIHSPHPHIQDRNPHDQPPEPVYPVYQQHAGATHAVHSGPQMVHSGPQMAVDPHMLMDQYHQVRQELERQRQLVEQLHFQLQQQQHQQQQRHSHGRSDTCEAPTLTDLERLRQELRDELEHREAIHRQELDALRQQQQQPMSPMKSSPTIHPTQLDRDDATMYKPPKPVNNGRRRRHDAFVQEALEEEDEDERQEEEQDGNQRLSPQLVRHSGEAAEVPGQRAKHQLTRSGLLLSNSSSSSLQCDSKLVFFDGRGPHPPNASATIIHRQQQQPEVLTTVSLEDSVDDLVRSVDRSQHKKSNNSVARSVGGIHASNNQDELLAPPPRADEDSDADDSLGFFVRTMDKNHTPTVDRYSHQRSGASLLLSSVDGARVDASTQSLHRRVRAIISAVDDDDEEPLEDSDESLDGEKLEAIFQRNVRRHEILRGFEATARAHPPDASQLHQLHQQLQTVTSYKIAPTTTHKEESLVASSRWMPSRP